jgi:hypothetical protein
VEVLAATRDACNALWRFLDGVHEAVTPLRA